VTVIEWEYRSVRYQASSNRRLPLEDGDEDRTVQFCVEVAQAGGSEDPSRAGTYKVAIVSTQRRLQYCVSAQSVPTMATRIGSGGSADQPLVGLRLMSHNANAMMLRTIKTVLSIQVLLRIGRFELWELDLL
jgi:hypothetical protein